MRSGVLVVPLLVVLAAASAGTPHHAPHRTPAAERARPNDNRVAAGVLRGGVLTLNLDARLGTWHPDGDAAPGAVVPAFAEAGRAPQIPGPLIRVPAGTEVAVTLRNRLAGDTLVVHGLHARPGIGEAVALAPGASRTLRFRLDAPGTYYYYGTSMGRTVDFRTLEDAQLTGAIVVDSSPRSGGAAPGAPPKDRVFVLGMWTDTVARAYTHRKRVLAVINGRSWPNTERLSYAVGDSVRWRVINATGDAHPMHLHGFYFRVDSRGDGQGDTTYQAGQGDLLVTAGMGVGTTMRLTWVPERPGNWLFHCHIPEHFAPRGPLGQLRAIDTSTAAAGSGAHTANHATAGMGGLVMGIVVRPSATGTAERATAQSGNAGRRRIRLLVRRNGGGTDSTPYFGFALQEGTDEPPADSGLRLGPPLLLVRGQPVSIMVVNALAEPTAVHWHGIELESYYDGVAGFSGDGRRVSPLVAPGDSFEVRFTPPRAGTFIYHTHADEERQQQAGLAGPLLVLEPDQRYDPATDHTVLVTSPWGWDDQRRAVMVNGSLTPPPLVLRAGVTHRLRFINMTVRRPALRVQLRRDTTLLAWRTVANDGADLPPARQVVGPAHHGLAIGQTFDVELTPDALGDLRLDVRIGGRFGNRGQLLGELPVRVVP
jgi:manganese oxidase